MRTLQDIERLIERHRDMSHFGPPAPEELIDRAETFLNLRFPNDYRAFLRRWGTLSIGPVEIYGITPDHDFVSSGIPNAIWCTQRKREEVGLPRHLVVLYNDNGEVLHCLDATDDSRSPVVIWDVIGGEHWGERAPSLFDYIVEYVSIFE
jgi:hypothetical protein